MCELAQKRVTKVNSSTQQAFQNHLRIVRMSTLTSVCDWSTSLDALSTAVAGRATTVLAVYLLIAYGFTWVLGWVYVGNLQYSSTSPPLILIGIAAFGPTISAFATMGVVHRK
jgi:hypothetical protein